MPIRLLTNEEIIGGPCMASMDGNGGGSHGGVRCHVHVPTNRTDFIRYIIDHIPRQLERSVIAILREQKLPFCRSAGTTAHSTSDVDGQG